MQGRERKSRYNKVSLPIRDAEMLTIGLKQDFEPRGVPGLVASGQGFVAAAGVLPAGKGGSNPLSPGVTRRGIMEYTLRPLKAEDKEFLRDLNERCYKNVVVRQFGEWDPELQRDFFEKKWDPDTFTAICAQEGDVGALSVWEEKDCLRLSEILVDPAFQNRGIGTEVVKAVLEEAESKDLKVRVQVLHENTAKQLYLRLGFVECGKTDTHVLMEFSV